MLKPVHRDGRRDRSRHLMGLGLSLGFVWLILGEPARADRITLRGGGQIHGKLIVDAADPNHLTFVGEVGKKPIIYKKEQILQIFPEKSALDEYVVLRSKDRVIAEEEYQLGIWCEDHKLKDLAEVHFEAAIRLDPHYAPGHEKLGHVLSHDRWLNADEQREASGMVKFRGRWMMPEEKERLDEQAAMTAENQSWTRRVKALRDAYLSGPDARAKDAEKRLLTIREVSAVGPIVRILGGDENAHARALAGRVLGAIPGPEASSALVARLLAEPDPVVREGTMTEAARRPAEEVVPRLVQALRTPRAETINRAAWSLGQLNAATAVPQLIPALVITEYQTISVPINGNSGGGGGLNSVSPVGGGSFSNYSGSTYLGLTPPVVAPGVVAYGAVGVPLGTGASIGGGGLGVTGTGLGIGGGGGGGGSMPRIVPIDHPNVEVLSTLVKLTGQDYGYDIATWKRWAAASFRSDPKPGRRVIQP